MTSIYNSSPHYSVNTRLIFSVVEGHFCLETRVLQPQHVDIPLHKQEPLFLSCSLSHVIVLVP